MVLDRHRREYDNLHDISSSAKQIKVRNYNGIKLMNMILVVACSRNGSVYKIRYERRRENWHSQENTVHLSGQRLETTVIQ